MDWVTHLEHFQVILKKFDIIVTLPDELLIQYFWDSLKS